MLTSSPEPSVLDNMIHISTCTKISYANTSLNASSSVGNPCATHVHKGVKCFSCLTVHVYAFKSPTHPEVLEF